MLLIIYDFFEASRVQIPQNQVYILAASIQLKLLLDQYPWLQKKGQHWFVKDKHQHHPGSKDN